MLDDNVKAKVTANKQAHAERVAAIRADKTLSEQGKAEAVARDFVQAQKVHRDLVAQNIALNETHRDDLVRRAVRTTAPGADPAAYRAALGVAMAAPSLSEAAKVAALVGDSTLTQAVSAVAVARGDHATLREVSADNPALAELASFDLANDPLASPVNRVHEGMTLADLRPPKEAAAFPTAHKIVSEAI